MELMRTLFTAMTGFGLLLLGINLLSNNLQLFMSKPLLESLISISNDKGSGTVGFHKGFFISVATQKLEGLGTIIVNYTQSGLINLPAAIAIYLGGCLGISLSPWFLGFHHGQFALPIMAISTPLLLTSQNTSLSYLGKVIFSIGLLLFGMDLLESGLYVFKSNSQSFEVLMYFKIYTLSKLPALLVIGIFFTLISNSSLIGIALVMVLHHIFNIEQHLLLAIICGVFFASSFLPFKSAKKGNIYAKRASLSIIAINFIVVVILFLYFSIDGQLANFISQFDLSSQFHVCLLFTLLHLLTIIIFLPFHKQFSGFIEKITPLKDGKQQTTLYMLGRGDEIIAVAGLAQSWIVLLKFMDIVERMLEVTKEYIQEEKSHAKLMAKLKDYERITDNIQKEIALFLGILTEKNLTHKQATFAGKIVKVADELESISDYLDKILIHNTNLKKLGEIDSDFPKDYFKLFLKIEAYYLEVISTLKKQKLQEHQKKPFFELGYDLKMECDVLRTEYTENIKKQSPSTQQILNLNDMVIDLRKVRSHTRNILRVL
jgi:phosphate:Na+ symporter